MQLSVIVPTYNRLARLRRVLAGLERQNAEAVDMEVIVISDGSTDGTNEWLVQRAADGAGPACGSRTGLEDSLALDMAWAAAGGAQVATLKSAPSRVAPWRLVPIIQANRGVAAARNAGLAQATGDLVLFVDDDVVPAPELVGEHLATHSAHGPGVIVLGPMLVPRDFRMQPWVRWEQAMLAKQYAEMLQGHWAPTARQFYTGNTSLARQHLVECGGFDPAFRRAEDVELAYRLAQRGLRFVFNPKAIGYHYAERSFQSWLQTPYLYGRNDVIFTRDKEQRWLLPAIWREYGRDRNPLTRGLVGLCLDRLWVAAPVISLLSIGAALGDRLGIKQLPRLAYSGIFNLRHYQGIADELGGREAFFAGVRQGRAQSCCDK